jgi:hypothetical protein
MAYNGNANLTSPKEEVEFTREQVQEFIRCSTNPTYFIETYVKIINIDRGLINFELYDYQKDIVNTSVNNRFVICKLPRQSGKTTTRERKRTKLLAVFSLLTNIYRSG